MPQVHAGDALLLPPYMYMYEVTSSAPEGQPEGLNVAVNYWFSFDGGKADEGGSPAAAEGAMEGAPAAANGLVPQSRLHRLLNERIARGDDLRGERARRQRGRAQQPAAAPTSLVQLASALMPKWRG